MNDKKLMTLAADNIRILAASMVEKAKSGHPGGAMGGADFINVLFSEFLVYDPENPSWEGRDRFFLDPGHMSPMLYSALCLQGKFTLDELKEFRQWGSPTPGHPERDIERGIENTSGPLGQGHTFAAGYDLATPEGCEATFKRFDELIGFSYLAGMHLNDSKSKLGGKLDRHNSIGKGELGWETFRRLMADPRLDNIPLVLETIDETLWKQEIAILQAFSRNENPELPW